MRKLGKGMGGFFMILWEKSTDRVNIDSKMRCARVQGASDLVEFLETFPKLFFFYSQLQTDFQGMIRYEFSRIKGF